MERIASALVELYLPITLGALYAVALKPDESFIRSASRALVYSFLPLLLFSSVYGSEPGELAIGLTQILTSAAIVASTSLAISYLITRDLELMLLSTYLNSGYLPIPVAYTMWGSDALPLVGFYILFNVTLGYVLAPLFLKGDPKAGVKELARFPPLYAILAGILLSATGIALPQPVENAVQRTGSVAPYLALFLLGAQALRTGIRADRDTAKVALVRFIAAPLTLWLLSPLYLKPGSLAYRVSFLEACMPPAVTNVVLFNVYSPRPERAARIVFTLTMVSAFTVPALMAMLG